MAIAETVMQMPKVVDLEIVGVCSGRRNRFMRGGVKACPLPTQRITLNQSDRRNDMDSKLRSMKI